MNRERFTQKSREALEQAQTLARERSHQELDSDHLLLALVEQQDGLTPDLLQKLSPGTINSLRTALNAELDRRPKVAGGNVELFASAGLRKALDTAHKEASLLHDE